MSVVPLTITEYRVATRSSHPHRRGRPVVVPYSRPRSRMRCPMSFFCSVGIGPAPTRVQYAFMIPTTRSSRRPGTPVPVEMPSAVQLELVTNGYVPWSTSSSVAFPPSKSSRLPWCSRSCSR